MSIKVYTQEEVDAILPNEYGVRHFPTGDYTAIKKFVGRCVFGESCKFGGLCEFEAFCVFGESCKFAAKGVFGIHCIFGSFCVFGGYCSFGNTCIFSEGCSFGQRCVFNHWCKVGSCCKFGEKCRFSTDCSFGKDCTFEDGHIAKTTVPFITLGGAGSEARTCYFYDFEKGIHVRAGCFFGTLEEFKAKVLKDEKTPETPSKKTKVYLGFCEVVELQFN